MGSLFRSEEMALCQLFMQSEVSYNCVSELGELGLCQFRDLNPSVSAFQRKFVNEVRRCDEMERKLRYIEGEIKKHEIPMADSDDNPEAPQLKEMSEMEITFEQLEIELREIIQNSTALNKNYTELTELKHILRKADVFFDEQNQEVSPNDSMTGALIVNDHLKPQKTPTGPVQLGFVAGVIPRDKIPPFETMLWRACRGNILLRQSSIENPIEDPSTGLFQSKSVFIIFYQGDRLKVKVRKICEGFRATLYPCPEAQPERNEMAMSVMTRIEDLNIVLGQTHDHKHKILVASAKNIRMWFIKVRKIKAIYHTLNLSNFDITHKCLIAECWVPVIDISNINLALRRGAERSGGSISPILNRMATKEIPPTFNRVNKVTSGFQNLVNAYGVATYREENPATYTIITFPFLFAVMFGDVGHGIIMALAGLWMVVMEKRLKAKKIESDVWEIFFGGRYIILFMGLFSIYTGSIYNDMFSKSINVYGSHWSVHYNKSTITTNTYLTLDPATSDYEGTPYPFGLDPIWQLAENKINFLNGYKMKISIIFGVIHMLFGVILSLKNYIFFKNKLDIVSMFIPQVLFLCCLFLYLVILVFVKWITYSPKTKNELKQPYCAPSILITFIDMVLLKANEGNKGCDPYMFTGQQSLQYCLLAIAVICIPWMLLVRPIAIQVGRTRKHKILTNHIGNGDMELNNKSTHHNTDEEHEEEDEAMSEIYIHQGIHTVEYVLGSVSHTASYLRLWALSLAHAQLSEVLWNMVFSKAMLPMFGVFKFLSIFIIFTFWAVLTIAILVLMEGLSAFLHTLRLHWVEFQSKFYDGKGTAFQPFSFQTILQNTGGDD